MSEKYIEFRDLNMSFGEQHVLRNVSFHMNKGETTVRLGRSGVGKSVSLKLIMGFLKADSGRVIVAEQDITDLKEPELQNVAFPMQTLKSVPEEQIEERVAKLVEMLEVPQFAEKLPSELSTGTSAGPPWSLARRKESLRDPAPALAQSPRRVLASHTGSLILKLKEKFHKTSVVTHDTHLARRLADSVIFLHQGEVTFFGSWADFETSEDLFIRDFCLQDQLIPALDVTAASAE